MNYLVRIFLILFLFTGCERDNSCFCVETMTDIENGDVYVNEYWVEDCYDSFQQTTVYSWGNIVIDCRK